MFYSMKRFRVTVFRFGVERGGYSRMRGSRRTAMDGGSVVKGWWVFEAAESIRGRF